MIKIVKQKQNVLYYECNCGVRGVCSFKPIDKDATIIIDINCPGCKVTERITMLQYKDEDSKQELLDNINNNDMSWTLFVNEELFDLKEET